MRVRVLTKAILAATLLGALAGCGAIYSKSAVTAGITDAAKVRVVPLTAETVLVANSTPYQPRQLPAYFNQTAGLQGTLATPIAPPEAAFDRVSRPDAVETRLPPALVPESYKIGVGDVVLLATPSGGSTVEQLTGILAAQTARQGYTVQDDGTVSIPSVGRVEIAGQNVEDAEATLFQRFLDQQIDPTFSLEVAEFMSKRVAVGGDVARPTVVPITLSPLFLDEALAAAGGAQSADLDTALVRIYREGKLYQVPLKALYDDPSIGRVQLADGDSVFVDTAYALDKASAYFVEQIELANFKQAERAGRITALNAEVALRRSELDEARGNFETRLELGAEPRDYAYLTGEVRTQSRFALPFDQRATLADALYDAGGGLITADSDVREIYVLRGSDNPLEYDSITAWNLDARNAASLVLATRFELHANDVVFVAANPVTHWSNVIDAITPTLLVGGANVVAN